MTQPPPPPGYDEPEAPSGYEAVSDKPPAKIPSNWEAFVDFMRGGSSLVTGPVGLAKGIGAGMDDPELKAFDIEGPLGPAMAPGSAILKAIASLGKLGLEGQAREKADIESITGKSPALDVILKALQMVPGGSMAPGLALSAADLGGSAATLAGADFAPPEAMRMSQSLKSGDIAGFMEQLGATVAQTGSLGLTGTPTRLGKALGMGGAAKAAPGGAGALATNLDTSAIKSEVLSRNVFAGGPPARSMPVPELTLPMTAGEQSGSKALQLAERNLEASLPGSAPFQAMREQAAQQVQDYGKMVGQYISKDISTAKGSRAAVARTVQQRVEEAIDVLDTNANKLYDQVWSHPKLQTTKGAPRKFSSKGTPVEKFADEWIPKLEPLQASTGEGGKVINALKSFKDPKLKYKTLEELQALKRVAFNSGETSKVGMTSGAAKQLAGAIDDTIAQHLEQAGGKPLVARWEVAKRRYTELKQVQDDRFVKGVLADNKDNAYALVKTAGIEDIDTFWKLLKPTDRQLVKARLVQDALEDAQSKPIRGLKGALLKATGGHVIQPTESTLNPAKFEASLYGGRKSAGAERMARMFDKTELQAIDTLDEAMRRTGNTNWKNVSGLLLNGMLYHQVATGNFAGAAALGGGTRLLSYMVTNPASVKVMSGYLDAIARAGEAPFTNPSVSYWGQRLAKEAERIAAEEKEKGTLP